MKGLLRAGAIALVVGLMVLAGRSWSEPRKAPAPKTRIALMNLSAVIKDYHKYRTFQVEIQENVRQYQLKAQEIQAKLNKAIKVGEDKSATAAQKADAEKAVRVLNRELEDLNTEAKNALGKKSDDQMVILYKEVREAAQRYAVAHDIELVLHYNDADEQKAPGDFWNPSNVARKMQAGAAMPLYLAPGIDISAEILDMLNAGRQGEKAPATDKK